MATVQGVVRSVLGEACQVEAGDQILPCVVSGRMKEGARRELHPVAVGDRVVVEIATEGQGAVTEVILPRRTKLSRPAKGDRDVEQVIVANAEQLMIVASVRKPKLKPGLIDRYMIAAENGLLKAVLCLNKVDLAKPKQYEEQRDIYEGSGYQVLLTSATEGTGLDEFRAALQDRFTVIAGQSGVGKSTLINAVEPGLDLKTARVSQATLKGKHTTTRVSRFPLGFGGWVADTPGVREFSLWDVWPDEIAGCFPEMVEPAEDCKFPGCTHRHEPECAVLAAVGKGRVHRSRHASYVKIRDYLESIHRYHRRAEGEPRGR